MSLKEGWWKWKEYKEEEHSSLVIWETEEDIGNEIRKLKIERDGYDSLSVEHKAQTHIFHKSMEFLISSRLDNNNNNNNNNHNN